MSNNTELHQIVMQQAQIIAQLTEQLAASVGVVSPTATVVTKDYDDTLTGSDLVREHFRRGGGSLKCFIDDCSDVKAMRDAEFRTVTELNTHSGFPFATALSSWMCAVACDDDGNVLTEDQLLGDL